jgi:6-phosphogluconolactonase (cycloisomerase 2 family)
MAHKQAIGAVYTMSNAVDGNSVLVFDRDKTGKLTPGGEFPTEGLGSGAGLGNQGAVILDPANRWLFVVNPGSDDISVFEVVEDGLELLDRVSSNGQQPISLTYSHNLLYVLNAGGSAGGSDSISGFSVGSDGKLTPITDSTRPLSDISTGPAQIQFNTDADVLVVTEKATDTIDTYTLDGNGIPSDPNPQPSSGMTPFGFAFGKRDQLILSEAAGGATDQGSLSSYVVDQDGTLTLVSSSVATTETAACWVVVSNDGRLAYTTNAGSGSVSAFRVDFDGELSLLDRNGKAALTGRNSTPIDMALSNDGRNLYTLNSGNATIGVFQVDRKGGLERLRSLRNLPVSANGLAAR